MGAPAAQRHVCAGRAVAWVACYCSAQSAGTHACQPLLGAGWRQPGASNGEPQLFEGRTSPVTAQTQPTGRLARALGRALRRLPARAAVVSHLLKRQGGEGVVAVSPRYAQQMAAKLSGAAPPCALSHLSENLAHCSKLQLSVWQQQGELDGATTQWCRWFCCMVAWPSTEPREVLS